jgi:hypothetical protein
LQYVRGGAAFADKHGFEPVPFDRFPVNSRLFGIKFGDEYVWGHRLFGVRGALCNLYTTNAV